MIKKTSFLVFLFGAIALELNAASIFPGLMGKQLIDSLRARYKTTRTLSDAACRDTIYGEIDLYGDSLVCFYSGWTIHGGPTSDPSSWANANDINPEHTWPQSLCSTTQATQDMHHLFPTEMQVNSYRGSLPFGECADASTTTWSRNNVHQSSIPGSNIDEWSETISNTRFEPREIQKGITARAMYYMLTFWQLQDTTLAWWTGQRDTLYKWHCQHPAAAAESVRTYRVAPHQQGKINPFVMDSTLIRRCYFPSIPTNTQVNFASTAATYDEAAGSFSLTVDIASPSGSNATTVQVVLTGGSGSAADVNGYSTQTLTFPAGSSAPQSATITITDDALVESVETIVFNLRNASGGSSAAVGGDSVFTLTINDNDRTTVGFSPISVSKTENDAPFNITVAVASPSGSAATTADVVLASGSGSAADINGYATQTVTFPAGSSASQNVAITITDDALVEGTETLVFKLRNVSGGSSAAPGADSAFTLTLADNDAPSGTAFLFEPFDYPAGDSLNGIHNWTLHSGTANPTRVVAPGLAYDGYKGKAVTNACSLTTTGEDLNRSFTSQTSGTIYASFLVSVDSATTTGDYFFHLSTATLSTSFFMGRIYVRKDASNNLAFGLSKLTEAATYSTYDFARRTTYPLVLKYKFSGGAQDDSVSLFVITTAIPGSEPATATVGPLGAPSNDPVSIGTVALRQGGSTSGPILILDDIKIGSSWINAPLAVTMAGFTCGLAGNAVLLRWRTESETNSYQWIIARADNGNGPYQDLTQIDAAGTGSSPRDYSWADASVTPGRTYRYVLTEVNLSGTRTSYGPLQVTVPAEGPARITKSVAYPNPFRMATTISYQLAAPGPILLRVYNATGQLVRTLSGTAGAGINRAAWDGKDQQGNRASPGVYFYRIETPGTAAQGKVILIK